MARRIRAHDWAATPLGPIAAWPQSLRTAVDLCLGSAVASCVWWGPELIQLYNDAALAINRAKRPTFLGQPAREAWADVWPEVGPLLAQVVASGASVCGDDLPMVPDRGGPREPAFFTFSYGPARDETGAVAGVFCTAIETTARVRAEEALRASEASLQQRVAEATAELRTLSRRLLQVQEDERRVLARELHDEIGQVLTGLNFQLAAAAGANGTAIAAAQATVQALTEQVRQLSMDLRRRSSIASACWRRCSGRSSATSDARAFRSTCGIRASLVASRPTWRSAPSGSCKKR
jgi:signal transduction histidine kinase